MSTSERNLRWRTKYPDRHKKNYEDWRVKNQERRNAYARSWRAEKRAADPVGASKAVRRIQLKRRYGITPEDYDRMLAAQGGRCALCERAPSQERFGHLSIDHCHDTGKIRGLLCTPHNSAIAAFGDNEDGLFRALRYIKGGSVFGHKARVPNRR